MLLSRRYDEVNALNWSIEKAREYLTTKYSRESEQTVDAIFKAAGFPTALSLIVVEYCLLNMNILTKLLAPSESVTRSSFVRRVLRGWNELEFRITYDSDTGKVWRIDFTDGHFWYDPNMIDRNNNVRYTDDLIDGNALVRIFGRSYNYEFDDANNIYSRLVLALIESFT